MKKLNFLAVALLILTGVSPTSQAQEVASGYNPNSIHPIHESHILFKKRVWRRMDLKEKQNMPFFSYNKEITKLIIEAVDNGTLFPYENDSLKTRMSKEKFFDNLTMPVAAGGLSEEEKKLGFTDQPAGWDTGGWGDDASKKASADSTAAAASASDELFLPSQVTVMEMSEDMIFDKTRSRLYWDIQSVTLILPANLFETGLQRAVGTFRFKDLVQVFRNMPEEAVWFNPQNNAANLNFADAFALNLYRARIIKVANPKDEWLVDTHGGDERKGLLASQQKEQELMELEHNLWEY